MNPRKVFWLLLAALLVVPLSIRAATPDGGTDRFLVTLEPPWSYGIISDEVGLAGIEVTDLNGDGSNETVTCSRGAAFALSPDGSGGYEQFWRSGVVNCSAIAVGDRDGDGVDELFVGTLAGPGGAQVLVYQRLGVLHTVQLSSIGGSDLLLLASDSQIGVQPLGPPRAVRSVYLPLMK